MKKAMLFVSFGSSYESARRDNIDKTVNYISSNFAEYDAFQAFTSNIIRKKLQKQGIDIDDPFSALARIKSLGYDEVVVVSLHLIAGFEYEKILNATKEFEFKSIKLTNPLLSDDIDYENIAKILCDIYRDVKDNIIFMGHGSEHKNDKAYEKLQKKLDDIEKDRYYVATVEGDITIDDVILKLERNNIKNVTLTPFMLVCGDHANNDMAGSDEDSWVNMLKGKGITSLALLKGLGEYEQIGKYFVKKVRQVI